MSFELKWLGHGSWSMRIGDANVLLDPFLDENPSAPCKAAELAADFILVSHGHFDHVADVAPIANRTSASVIAVYEIAEWFGANHDVQNTIGMNLGGGIDLPFGRVTMTLAHHSSQLPDGAYGGNPAGFVVEAEGKRVYFACDTALFSDMQLIGQQGIDLAVLPIGDLFTMGLADSVAATKLIHPKRVAPAHYNTWPPIEQDAETWATMVRKESKTEPIVIEPGGVIEV
jgi:L-ascorbate metabolism protein UlaG (beta-lactamase superfamily)